MEKLVKIENCKKFHGFIILKTFLCKYCSYVYVYLSSTKDQVIRIS